VPPVSSQETFEEECFAYSFSAKFGWGIDGTCIIVLLSAKVFRQKISARWQFYSSGYTYYLTALILYPSGSDPMSDDERYEPVPLGFGIEAPPPSYKAAISKKNETIFKVRNYREGEEESERESEREGEGEK
jgi:hypothetical protein